MTTPTTPAVPALPVFIATPTSSQIYGLAYEGDALWVKFKTGSVYRYILAANAPEAQRGILRVHFDSMMRAESVGKYFGANVKGNALIAYERVTTCSHCGASIPPRHNENNCDICVPGTGEPPIAPPQARSKMPLQEFDGKPLADK